jgi:hypothetical protein
MYNETKIALRKAFEISKTLFFIGPRKYSILLNATSSIGPPSKKELEEYTNKGKTLEEAVKIVIKEKYRRAAISAGFTKDQGIAMLEYAAMLEEIKE